MITDREKKLIAEIMKKKKQLNTLMIDSPEFRKCFSELSKLREELELERYTRIRLREAARRVNIGFYDESKGYVFKMFGLLSIIFACITVVYMTKFKYLDQVDRISYSGILLSLTSICALLFYFGYLKRRIEK